MQNETLKKLLLVTIFLLAAVIIGGVIMWFYGPHNGDGYDDYEQFDQLDSFDEEFSLGEFDTLDESQEDILDDAAGLQTKKYGNHKQMAYSLFIPSNVKRAESLRLVVVVPGGGWVLWPSPQMDLLGEFFADRGYAVATVAYRVCPGVRWPTPVHDVGKGIDAAIDDIQKQGYRIQDITLTGDSAGAVSEALLLYSDKYPNLSARINRFIGLVGVYSPTALNRDLASDPISNCQLSPDTDLVYNGKTSVPALLLGGESDQLDLHANTNQGHQPYLANLLKQRGIDADAHWFTRRDIQQTCGHECFDHVLDKQNKKFTQLVEAFMRD